jgi:hypothetical protein
MTITSLVTGARAPAGRVLLSLSVLGVLFPAAVALPHPQDLTGRFLLLATTKTGTMEEELEEAAAAGYRVVTGSPTSGTEMALVLEKVATPPDTYQYLLLATTRTGTMQRELYEAAAEGFRLLPDTMISKSQMFGGDEIVVIMERAPNSNNTYEYMLLATSFTSTLQAEMAQAIDNGFEVVGMVSRGEHVLILERSNDGG